MLKEEIDKAQRLVKTDAYQISIGEIINMYKDGELIINPDFQRLFRWEIGQKSKLVESILLGIPLPSIFVFEKDDGKWELIDGLQRVSTLLEFIGLLKSPANSQVRPPSALVGTKYLPSLNNVVWEKSPVIEGVAEDDQHVLDSVFQLTVRRARLSVEILKRNSDNATKYDLFQRLNAGGISANAQELRNCIIIMVSPDYSQFMHGLADYQAFLTVLAASEEQIEKQRHMEYVSRFLVHAFVPYDNALDVEEFIDEGVVALATAGEVDSAGYAFRRTFDLLNAAHGDGALRRIVNGVPSGRVGLAAFECIAVGIGKNIAHIDAKTDPVEFVRSRIAQFWQSSELQQFFSAGMRGTTRIQRTIPFGTNWFST
jgi:hypothetical protein